MDEIHDELLAIERELAGGGGEAYRRHLAGNALVVVPGAKLDTEATIAAMDRSPGWDAFELGEERVLRLSEEAALLSYGFRGRRGGSTYRADLTSIYIRDPDGTWKLVHHQQTPVES